MSVSATPYLTYGAIRSQSVPIGIAIWGLMCIFFPYSWRGALTRFTFKCPSFILAVFFLCIGVPIHFGTAQLLPDVTVNVTLNNPGMAKFVSTIQTNAMLFVGTHLIMVLLRFKWTLTKWQALIFCEIAKNMYIVLLLWGYYTFYPEEDGFGPNAAVVEVLVWFFVAVLLTITFVRLFYAVRCQFDGNKFNHLYFGTDSNCPMQRFYLMCKVCEKSPNTMAFQEHVDDNDTVVKNPVRESNIDRLQNLQEDNNK